jgi:hypothetical protein
MTILNHYNPFCDLLSFERRVNRWTTCWGDFDSEWEDLKKIRGQISNQINYNYNIHG